MKKLLGSGLVLMAAMGLLACRSGGASGGTNKKTAVAELKDQKGESFGRVTFEEQATGIVGIDIRIDAKTSTLATEGEHAIHVHEGTHCAAPSFSSAGGHWNPTNEKHGNPEHAGHHSGDLGNVEIKSDRTGEKKLNTIEMTLEPDKPASIVGRTVIVHVKADDFVTQNPPGNAGGRIACGVITMAQ